MECSGVDTTGCFSFGSFLFGRKKRKEHQRAVGANRAPQRTGEMNDPKKKMEPGAVFFVNFFYAKK